MLALLLATVCGVCPTPGPDSHDPAPTANVQNPDSKPLKALTAWMKLYKKGKIDYRDKQNIGSKESIAVKFKVRTASDLGNPTWSGDLIVILKATAELGSAEAAKAITEVASVGIEDKGKYTYSMAPYSVRVAAFEALATMTSKQAKDAVAAGARGEWSKGRAGNSLRAAALLGLGYLGDLNYVPVVKAALADGHSVTRIHAVEALQRLGDEKSIHALISVVEKEGDDAVLVTAAKGLRAIYSKFIRDAEEKRDREAVQKPMAQEGDKPADNKKPIKPPPSARLAVRAAIKALGRTNWRADMVLVRLLGDFRSSESVPALIAVLERFRDNPKDVVTGKLSGLLRVKVHELLVSMTGAVYSSKQPEKWRELWDKEKGKIKIAQSHDAGPKVGGTASAGFVGIPVEGTRVVFILDLSGSMDWPMDDQGGKVKRLDYAKRELLKAIDGLSPDSMFNLVTFNGDDEAEMWSKKLVDANKRNKDRFKKFIEKRRPLGGTNLWSGMEAALNIKLLKYGNHYETTVDEIFLLSDGAPSVGDVQDPIEILRLISEVNRFKEVRINTVFISSQTPPDVQAAQGRMSLVPKELMRRMAKQNGGKFRDV
jgi:HEAT repeat protein